MKPFILAFSVAVCLTTQASAAGLTGADIKSKVIGHSLSWNSAKFNASGVTLYNSDGTAMMTPKGGEAQSGTWRVRGNKLCDKFGQNKESCSTVSQVDDHTFFFEAYESTAVFD